MKTMTMREFKSQFSEALKLVIAGEEIGIRYGGEKEIIARLVPESRVRKTTRKIGMLDGKAKVRFREDFKMTEEEFLRS